MISLVDKKLGNRIKDIAFPLGSGNNSSQDGCGRITQSSNYFPDILYAISLICIYPHGFPQQSSRIKGC
jgi:hypothetical protein